MKIVKYPHTSLRAIAAPVTDFGPSLHKNIHSMAALMAAKRGIGLAGNQVQLLQRVIVIGLGETVGLVNPEIISHSDTKASMTEGCLSLPGQYFEVTRPAEIKIKATLIKLDETIKDIQLECSGLLAACVQHEIDHLNGRLILDYGI